MRPLLICSSGAVTPVGLTASQTCAAMRAGVNGFRDAFEQLPPEEPIVCARIPARKKLKDRLDAWLVNLAVRAIRECLDKIDVDPLSTAVLVSLPEGTRPHSTTGLMSAVEFLGAVEAQLGVRFHGRSTAVPGGSAAGYQLLTVAGELLRNGVVRHCVVGGVDSLANEEDVARLARAGRLHLSDVNPQGVIPGEAAAFVVVCDMLNATRGVALAQILGVGSADEENSVLGDQYSTGTATTNALLAALTDAAANEPDIDLRVSDMNGERYRAWESMLSTTRFYRTHRERLITWYPAASVGDTGAAAGALGLVMAATGLSRGYAPGRLAMLEAASDGGLRAACVMSLAPGSPTPPFRLDE
jgi:3-oxoacyl-[acyl-carrier-protein] synthase I